MDYTIVKKYSITCICLFLNLDKNFQCLNMSGKYNSQSCIVVKQFGSLSQECTYKITDTYDHELLQIKNLKMNKSWSTSKDALKKKMLNMAVCRSQNCRQYGTCIG